MTAPPIAADEGSTTNAFASIDTLGPGDEPPVAEQPDGTMGRRVTAVALVALLAIGVATVALRPVPPEALLGRVGSSTGVTASGLPAGGLAPAWVHEIDGSQDQGYHDDVRSLVVGDGLARVGRVVADLDDGSVVRVDSWHVQSSLRSGSRISGDDLVVVDLVTGEVVSRAPLTDAAMAQWSPAARADGVTLLSHADELALVTDDGAVVSRHPGRIYEPYTDDARRDPAALPVRGPLTVQDRMMEGTPSYNLGMELVRASDGRVVLERQPSAELDILTVDVVGDRAVVSSTASEGFGRAGEEGSLWRSELVDATTGAVVQTLRFASVEVPRILGRAATGEVLVGVRVGRSLSVWAWGERGAGLVAESVLDGEIHGDGLFAGDSVVLRRAAVTDDGLLVVLEGAEAVARAVDGTVVWRVEAETAVAIAADRGVVALLPSPAPSAGAPTATTRLLSERDGSLLTTVRSVSADHLDQLGATPVSVVGDHVGVAPPFSYVARGLVELDGTVWLDLRTGETASSAEVLAPWAGEDQQLREWRLHGMMVDEGSGAQFPVVTFVPSRELFQILEPDGPVTHELPLPGADDVAGHYTEPVGASADWIVTSAQFYDGRDEGVATYVVDRGDGSVTSHEGLLGHTMGDGVLVAHEFDGASWEHVTEVGVDLATGERLWESDDLTAPWGPPPRHDGRVAVHADGLGVLLRDLRTGRTLWEHDAAQELHPRAVLGADAVLVATTDGQVVALDRDDGAEVWRTAVGAPVLSVAGAGGGAIVGTLSGAVVVLDDRGREVDRVTLAGPVQHVAALGETVVATVAGEVVGLRADATGIVRRDRVELP